MINGGSETDVASLALQTALMNLPTTIRVDENSYVFYVFLVNEYVTIIFRLRVKRHAAPMLRSVIICSREPGRGPSLSRDGL